MMNIVEEFIYELNNSKKTVTSESNKEITKNLDEVYTNKEDSNQYYNKNLKDNIIALKEIYSFISFNELENTKKKFIKNIL